ncbi:unnamed protein product [Rangifer tarandus platyrhynchus]|uniref:Uncharacterized protein n=1 Tax=Rangifer tarandus platyrhynchus TaxID=3082113 RepID=A0AC59YRZ4_RANTA
MPCVPDLASSLLNDWVVLRGQSAEDLLLRGHGMSVHQHFPHFEKMASFQPVKTAPQVKAEQLPSTAYQVSAVSRLLTLDPDHSFRLVTSQGDHNPSRQPRATEAQGKS